MDERNNHFDFDFTPIGQAIKKAREARGMTREQLSGIIDYARSIVYDIHIYDRLPGDDVCRHNRNNPYIRFHFPSLPFCLRPSIV